MGATRDETAAMERVCMAVMPLDPAGKGQARWVVRGKTVLDRPP
ncbi:hypothetical protein ACGFLS_22715 [Streptomyces abikoensis]